MIHTDELTRTYRSGAGFFNVSLSVKKGEFVAIMGPSGSGKTTLMNVIGCLDRQISGSYLFDGEDIAAFDDDALAALRNRKIGFVFQNFYLLDRLTALENVELPMIYAGVPKRRRRGTATEILARFGLENRMRHRPTELSGGQQQRVAIARALVNSPKVLLADEPTGALDSHTSMELMTLLQNLNRGGMTIVLITHDADVARFASRVVQLRDGRVLGTLESRVA
jgi:putative ABC transport system ATP-binding protein